MNKYNNLVNNWQKLLHNLKNFHNSQKMLLKQPMKL